MPVVFENTSNLPQEILFYPLPKTITYEPEQVPIKILPSEKFTVFLTFRGHEIKKEEGYIRCKIITGTIATTSLKFGYKATVCKSPIKFSPLKIKFPSLQFGESSNHIMHV